MTTDLTQLAAQCGATIYRHRLTPQSPALAFGDEAWARFQTEVEALRKDAERYRFIRSGGACIEPSGEEMYMATEGGGKYYHDLRDFDMDLDDAIDAARKEQA